MSINRRNFIGKSITAGILLPQASALASILDAKDYSCSTSFGDKNDFCTYGNIQSKIISTRGDRMSDSFKVPPRHDGMGIVSQTGNYITLIRNHEISDGDYFVPNSLKKYAYDPKCAGGTTTVTVDSDFNIVEEKYSLIGTVDNCSGGITPWNTWLTCEEDMANPANTKKVSKKHGYVFEVDPNKSLGENSEPIKEMGRFNHEAAVVDPATSIVYLTEDRWDSCFYRFIPNVKGQLRSGGKLQALKLNRIYDTKEFNKNRPYTVEWIDIEEVDPDSDTVRVEARKKGAQTFVRGEGASWHLGKVYFTCTQGGRDGKGQIFAYNPIAEELELFYEATNSSIIRMPDNICSTPWGDLLVCEDDGELNLLTKITQDGKVSRIAKSTNGEWAGVCADSTGKYIFANLQKSGLTIAFTDF